MFTMTSPRPEKRTSRNSRASSTLSYVGVLLALGAWALVSALVFDGPPVEVIDDVFVGGCFLALAGYNYYVYHTTEQHWIDAPRVAVLVGLWLVPFSLHVGSGGQLMTDSILLGVVAAVSNAYFYRRFRRHGVDGADH